MSDSEKLSPPHYWFSKRYADIVQRLRVAFGFLLLVAFGWLTQPSVASMVLGLPIAILGLSLRAWAAGHLAKNQQLATTGPFAYLRNPLYAGTLVVAVGIVIASGSVWLALMFSAVFVLVYLPAIELEEQHLRAIFPEYAVYALRVRRFLPLRKWANGDSRFSWPLYRRNEEHKALIGFLLAVGWLLWKCSLSAGGKISHRILPL